MPCLTCRPHAHQDETASKSERTAVENALNVTQCELTSESTPAEEKYGPDMTCAPVVETSEEDQYHLGKEMDGRWFGAMPVDAFLDNMSLPPRSHHPTCPHIHSRGSPGRGGECPPRLLCEYSSHLGNINFVTRFVIQIAAITGWMPHLQAVNTSAKVDTMNNLNLKPDVSVYNRVEGVAPPDKTDFSRMELWMEFKTKNNGAAFQDPRGDTKEERLLAIERGSFALDTEAGNRARGQLAHYAGAQHSLQFRHFSFSIVVRGDHARFLRWDPSGTVVTAAFNYRANPELMAEFLWRFDHLSPRKRGHEESIQPVNLSPKVDARVREKLGIKDSNTPLYRYGIPGLIGMGHAYGPRPPTQSRSLVSRCTLAFGFRPRT